MDLRHVHARGHPDQGAPGIRPGVAAVVVVTDAAM